MSDATDALAEFHKAFGVDAKDGITAVCRRRITLHQEEQKELEEALDDLALSLHPNRKELTEAVARELADVLYIAFGTAHLLGIDLDAAFAEVHRANMDKFPDCENPGCLAGLIIDHDGDYIICGECEGTGKGAPLKREDGKITRPNGWIPPSMECATR